MSKNVRQMLTTNINLYNKLEQKKDTLILF